MTMLALALDLSASRQVSASAAVIPGSSATTLSASDIPSGATVYQYHIPTATLTTTTRADGRPGVSAVRRVQGDTTATLNAGAGSNLQPILQTDRNGLKRLVFTGNGSGNVGEYLSMVDAITLNSRRCAVFVVTKPTQTQQYNEYLSVGQVDGVGAGTVQVEVLEVYDDANSGTIPTAQRVPRLNRRYVSDGTDPTYSVNVDRIVVGEQMQCLWGVVRDANDTSMNGGANRYVRGGVNETGFNGDTTLPTGSSQTGFTIGVQPSTTFKTARKLQAMIYEIIVVDCNTPASLMTFQQAQNIAASICTNWNLQPITRSIVDVGDSRRAQNNGTLGSTDSHHRSNVYSTYPDGSLPTTCRYITYGAGGTTLQQLETWIGAGTPIKAFDTYKLQGAGKKNFILTLWSHNDFGNQASTATYYGDTTADAGTKPRVDKVIAKYIQLIGTATNNLFTCGFDEVWVWNSFVTGTTNADTVYPYFRGDDGGTAPNNLRSAGFITACQNGNPSRVIRIFDRFEDSYNLPLYNTSDLSTVTTTVAVVPWKANILANDPRQRGTSGSTVYGAYTGTGSVEFPYLSIDTTHLDIGGSRQWGTLIGQFGAQYL